MICNNCNAQLPEGSTYCNFCGATFYNATPQQGLGYIPPQQPMYGSQLQQPMYGSQPQQPMYGSQPPAAPKPKSGIVLIIVNAILYVALIILIVLLAGTKYEDKKEDFIPNLTGYSKDLLDALQSSSYNGTYVLDHCEYLGFIYTVDELSEMTGDSYEMKLVISGNTCTLDGEAMGYDEESCQIEFDGDQVTLIDAGEELEGTYDEEEQSITFNMYGVDMIFVKEQ